MLSVMLLDMCIRYAAGYVFCALRKKILKSAYPQKEQLSDIVEVLLQNDDQDDSAEHDTSCEWMEIVDRGGLIHISDELFRVFIAIELEICIRRHFRVENSQKITASYEGKVAARILTNEDVLFHWCMVCCDVPEELSNELLKRIVELWTTICGFSFAKSYMEMYKQATKKVLQRSKFKESPSARTSFQLLPRYNIMYIVLHESVYNSTCSYQLIVNSLSCNVYNYKLNHMK